ncbi:integrase/recombinase xerD homolog [Palaemon carinicauda]|uniref:integrase/recombinase xerD homolog n=1 Tax=Palaemon carinicauda TaxID=392227 RepID=UPI0035B66241
MCFPGVGVHLHVNKAVIDSGVSLSSRLGDLTGHMCGYLLSSKSDSTNKTYKFGFQRWKVFINGHERSEIPAQPVHVALYITHLLDSGASYSSVNSAVYSIKWMHEICGYADPTQNSFVKSLQESAKRLTGRPVRRKDPIDSHMLQNLCDLYSDSRDVLVLRNLAMILIGFAGFLRFDESSSLKCKDFIVEKNYLRISIEKCKNDQYREGNEVLIAKGVTSACPYSMFLRYTEGAKIDLSSDSFIFKPSFRSKGISKLIRKNKKLSYTAARQNIVTLLKLVAPNLNIGLHSLRSGGATAAANMSVNERCFQRHGRWKSVSSKNVCQRFHRKKVKCQNNCCCNPLHSLLSLSLVLSRFTQHGAL